MSGMEVRFRRRNNVQVFSSSRAIIGSSLLIFFACAVSGLSFASPKIVAKQSLMVALPLRDANSKILRHQIALKAAVDPDSISSSNQAVMGMRPNRLRRWRNRFAAASVLASILLWPRPAWARAARRAVASRAAERQAGIFTAAFIVLIFVLAYFNSQKEDTSEQKRIKGEVERLVRLKKEFEETEDNKEDLDDDSMAAALSQARQKMAEEAKEQEEAKKDGEGGEGDSEEKDEDSKDGKDDKDDDTPPSKPPSPPKDPKA
eukprot:TRINITY_DN8545_c0_g2_i1.p1 TRINITY_DN8545_c0_g2~~TRINITY_DN8545_c0_g2_i1.p1  ORF type:complete len:261 (+),score=79.78 TRINITY_DN8545_c0_g2_i1:72-854(+)